MANYSFFFFFFYSFFFLFPLLHDFSSSFCLASPTRPFLSLLSKLKTHSNHNAPPLTAHTDTHNRHRQQQNSALSPFVGGQSWKESGLYEASGFHAQDTGFFCLCSCNVSDMGTFCDGGGVNGETGKAYHAHILIHRQETHIDS